MSMYDKIIRECSGCGNKGADFKLINITEDKEVILGTGVKIKVEAGFNQFCNTCMPNEFKNKRLDSVIIEKDDQQEEQKEELVNRFNPEDDKDDLENYKPPKVIIS